MLLSTKRHGNRIIKSHSTPLTFGSQSLLIHILPFQHWLCKSWRKTDRGIGIRLAVEIKPLFLVIKFYHIGSSQATPLKIFHRGIVLGINPIQDLTVCLLQWRIYATFAHLAVFCCWWLLLDFCARGWELGPPIWLVWM